MKKILTLLLAALGLTTACGQDNFENTDVQGFAELVADTNVVVLDVRTAAEFAEGHIDGAILIDQGQSDFVEKAKAAIERVQSEASFDSVEREQSRPEDKAKLPTDKKIAMYCRSGRRSANAAGRLADIGYKCVNLKGGIIAWKDAGMPVTKD